MPSDPPPSYEQAIRDGPECLPQEARNGIPLHARRSMEDELRPLPKGWVREFDPATQHQFFVDTMSSPPRSIWHHPYDDETYLNSLPASEREQIRATQSSLGPPGSKRRPSQADIIAESTDDEDDDDDDDDDNDDHDDHQPRTHLKEKGGRGQRPQPKKKEAAKKPPDETRSLGRRFKDALTGTTHEQRAAERARRAAAERELYRQHRQLRRAMLEAMRTGRPQPLGRDEDRVHVFLEPPGHTFPGVVAVRPLSPYVSEVFYDDADGRRPGPPGRYLRPEPDMYGYGYGAYGCGKFAGGRWDRPADAYHRPGGMGFGGGMGFPMMAPLVGGMMLGGLMGSMF